VATSTIYKYDLNANTWSTYTYVPATETFTTGSSYGVVTIGGKASNVLVHKDVTNRIFRLNAQANQMQPQATQYLFAQGAAVVGDKSVVIQSPEGISFYYLLISTSNIFARTALFF
jgi:UDP-N-acetylenolpyruvoylglucosamine reductase